MLGNLEAAQAAAEQETQRGALVRQSAQALSVTNDGEYQTAAALLLQIKEKIKELDNQRKAFVAPLNDVVKKINAFFKAPIDAYGEVELSLKSAMGSFQMELARQRQAALEEAAKAAAAQKTEDFSALMGAALDNAPVKAAGTFTRDVWRYEVLDPSLVPREYLMVDERKIGEVVRTLKGDVQIPGVRVWSETTVVARGK